QPMLRKWWLGWCWFIFAGIGLSQEVTGSIVGQVLDSSGASVAGAKVSVTNTDRNALVREVTTDTAGNYSALVLPVGHYSITVEAPGFKKAVRTSVELNVN